MPQLGKILIIAGVILVIAGLTVYFAGNKFGWFGHLPGDIRIEKENIRIYFPITTMLLLSIAVSVIIWLVKKIF
jgi:H+/Cl- antiporter ClcA